MDEHKINQHQENMLSEPPLKLFLRYVIPSMISMLLSTTAFIVDGWFVGNYIGTEALAAVSLVMPVFSLLFGITSMFAMGGVVRYSFYIGQRNKQAANAIFTKVMIFEVLISVLISVLSFVYARPILRFLGASEEVYPFAYEYYVYIILFAISYILAQALPSFLRAEGHAKLPTYGALLASVLNVFLDWYFIAHTDMGIKGLSLASGLSVSITALFYVGYFTFDRRGARLTAHLGRWFELWQASLNGVSETISELSGGLIALVFNRVLMQAFDGGAGVSAYTITQYCIVVVVMISFGMSMGLGSVISTNNGAGLLKRTHQFLRIELLVILCVGVLVFAVASFAQEALVQLFLPEASSEVLEISRKTFFYMRWVFVFIGCNIIIGAYFTALEKAKESGLIATLRSIALPIGFALGLAPFFGVTTVYLVFPLSELLTLAVAAYLLIRLLRRESQEKSQKME